jgi:hypothetical protein
MTVEGMEQFAKVVKTTYPREKLLDTAEAFEIWMRFLEDIPDEVGMAVLAEWIAHNRWSPSIADIREGAVNKIHGDVPDWGEAWQTVIKAVGRFGRYQEPDALNSLDDITRACVENIGWQSICNGEEADIGFIKRDFEMLYKGKTERKKREMQGTIMIGNMEGGRICG